MLPVQPPQQAAPAGSSSGDPDVSHRRLSDRSVALASLGSLALRTPELKVLFDETVRLLALTLRVEYSEILQIQESRESLVMLAAVGWKRRGVRPSSLPAGIESQADFTLRKRSAVVVRDLCAETRFKAPAPLPRKRVVSGMSVIIGTEHRPWGVLGVHSSRRRNFNGRDVHFLQAAAHIISEAINRHHAESELRDQERRLRLVTDAIPALVAYCDQDLIYRYCNARYTEWFGIEPEDVIGKRIVEVVGAEAFAKVEPAIRSALRGKRAVLETLLPYRLGPSRDVRVEYIPHIAGNGKVAGFYAMISDISERVRAEATRGWLASIVEHSHDAVIGKSLDGTVTSWNAAAERMYGYPPEEILGRSVECLFPPNRRDEMRSILARVAKGEAVIQEETVRLRKDGALLDVMVTVSPIRGEKDQVLGASSIAHDISPYKQAVRARSESEERLALATEAAGLGIYDWGIDSGGIRADARVRELWGIAEPDPVTFTRFLEGIDPEDRARTQAALERSLDPEGDGNYSIEYRVTKPADGVPRWIAATGQVTFEAGRPARMVGTVQDITERKKIEAQKQEWADRLADQLALTQRIEENLRRSNRDLEEFTGIVTHDLRSPLASALFTAELLRETVHSGDLKLTDNLLDLVLQSLRQMDELIKELHNHALVRGPEGDQREVNLDEILSAARLRAHLLLEGTGGQLVIEHPLPTIRGNPAMLGQLFLNLIENAVKYRSDKPPLIRVQSTCEHRHHRVIVSDNGRGVPERDRERIFMSRERGSNVAEVPGTGLGLALCRRIMQAHGGTVSVTASEEGGAAFELLFPAIPDPAPPI